METLQAKVYGGYRKKFPKKRAGNFHVETRKRCRSPQVRRLRSRHKPALARLFGVRRFFGRANRNLCSPRHRGARHRTADADADRADTGHECRRTGRVGRRNVPPDRVVYDYQPATRTGRTHHGRCDRKTGALVDRYAPRACPWPTRYPAWSHWRVERRPVEVGCFNEASVLAKPSKGSVNFNSLSRSLSFRLLAVPHRLRYAASVKGSAP